jgi:hypothetical protein
MNHHPALESSKSVLIPGAYNNLGLHCQGGTVMDAMNGGRQQVGGSLRSDAEDFYNEKIPHQYHSGLESLGNAALKDMGFGLYAGMNGNRGRGGSLVSDAKDFYNERIPEQYHPGLESLGRAGLKDMGFGLYAGQKSYPGQGRGFFSDSDDIFGKMLDGLTEGGKKILSYLPQALTTVGMPQLAAATNYLTEQFVDDPNDEAGKSRRRAEEARNPPVKKPAPAPFKADLPSVPYRKPKVNMMKPAVSDFNKMPDSYSRFRDNNGQGMGFEDEFKSKVRSAYDEVPHHLHPAIEAFGKAGMNSLGYGLGDYVNHFKSMVNKIKHHIPKEHHHHLEHIGRAAMDHSLHHIGMGMGIEPYVDSSGERPMSLDWIGKHTGIPGINDKMFGGEVGDGLACGTGEECGKGMEVEKGMKPKLVKGSEEAKAFMAAMRAKRGKGKKKMEGGELPPRSRSYTTDPSLI